jgi:hypothetical protein
MVVANAGAITKLVFELGGLMSQMGGANHLAQFISPERMGF